MKRILHALAALWSKGREHEGPWLPDARNGLLRHAADVMRMEGAIEELMVGKGRISSTQSQHTTEDREEAPLPKRVILPIDETDNSDTGKALAMGTTLAHLYLQDAHAQNETTEESTDTNSEPNVKRHFPMPLMSVFLALFMCLLAVQQVSAQSEPAASAAGENIKPLQIGDTIPEELWHMPLQVVNHPEGKETITLNDYRGKLIILDFWATWCGACIAAFPKMDALKNTLGADVEFIRVTYQNPEEAIKFFTEKTKTDGSHYDFYTSVKDAVLRTSFPHMLLPHYVWINPLGVVETFSSSDELTVDNIRNVTQNKAIETVAKHDLKRGVPLFMIDGFQGKELVYHSVLRQGVYPGLPSGNQYYRDEGVLRGRAMTNTSLKGIYSVIAGQLFKSLNLTYHENRLIINVTDPALLEEYYNYELLLPHRDATSLYEYMLQDLNRYTPFNASIENREVSCYVLTANVDENVLVSADDSSGDILRLVGFLNRTEMLDLPVIDETGLKFPLNERPNVSNYEQLVAYLDQLGFALHKTNRNLNFLVITDKIEQL